MLDGVRKGLSRRRSATLAEKGLEQQVDHVAHPHEARETAQEPNGLHWMMKQLVKEYSAETRVALAVDHLARQAGPIDLGALEKLEPVAGIVDQVGADVFLPQWGAAIDAEAVEVEGVERKPCGKIKSRPQVGHGLVGVADHEEAVHDFDSRPLGVADRGLNLLKGLVLFEPVEDFLTAALDPEHHGAAIGLCHQW